MEANSKDIQRISEEVATTAALIASTSSQRRASRGDPPRYREVDRARARRGRAVSGRRRPPGSWYTGRRSPTKPHQEGGAISVGVGTGGDDHPDLYDLDLGISIYPGANDTKTTISIVFSVPKDLVGRQFTVLTRDVPRLTTSNHPVPGSAPVEISDRASPYCQIITVQVESSDAYFRYDYLSSSRRPLRDQVSVMI